MSLIGRIGIGVLFVGVIVAQQRLPEVVRVRNYSVVVDVVVTDKNNRYVAGLAKEDFQIFENEIPQEIDSVHAVDADASEKESAEAATQPATNAIRSLSRTNLLIILLDYATTEYLNQTYVREAAIEYVKEKVTPDDFVAIFRVGMGLRFLQEFTNDKEALVTALRKLDLTGTIYVGDQEMLAGQAQSAQDQVQSFAAAFETLSSAPVTPSIAVAIQTVQQQMELAQRIERTYYAMQSFSREQQSRPIIDAIEAIATGVQHISGRKTLILFSQGFSVPLTLERRLYRAVEQANKANLAIYAIDSGGLQLKAPPTEGELYDISALRPGDRVIASGGLSQFDRAREVGSDQKDSTLRFLASATGGFLIRHTNDLLGALERVGSEIRSHYVLTYQPKNLNFDGEFRSIRVEVNRKDADVRARSGYWAVPPGAGLLSADEFKKLRNTQAELHKIETPSGRSFPLFSQPSYFAGAGGQYLVHLTLEVPTTALHPQQDGENFKLHLEAVGLIEDDAGEVISSFRGPNRLRLTSGQMQAARHIRLENTVNLSPGQYSISVVVTDPITGLSSYHQRGLSLPPLTGDLSTSSLVLGKFVEATPAGNDGLFTVDNVRIFPSAERNFANGDKLIYYLNIYHPGLSGERKTKIELRLSLVHNGREVTRSLQELATDKLLLEPVPHVQLARYLTLEKLPVGIYQLRAEVFDRVRNETRSAQTAFRIVR